MEENVKYNNTLFLDYWNLYTLLLKNTISKLFISQSLLKIKIAVRKEGMVST